MEKRLLAILGAGQAALPIIEKAKEMGVEVLAFARLDSFAKDMVDVFVEENSFDVDFMAKVCRERDVNGVMATSELTTEVAANLAAKLGLPGNSIVGGFAGKNKYVMRSRVAQLVSIKQPGFQLYNENVQYTYPVVVKPSDSCGKRGVSIVRNSDELVQKVYVAKENSTNGEVLVEEYLAGGKEYSIECLSFNGIHQIVQYTEKESSGPPHFVETAHHQPAALSDELKRKIQIAVSDVLEVLGLTCGMAHLELKVIDNELYFIEVGARGGGDHISDVLTVRSTDFDYFKAAIECALGTYKPIEPHTVAYTGIYFHCLQNDHLGKLFQIANVAKWCVADTVRNNSFEEATSNVETSNSGYLIYCADHKIGLRDCAYLFKAELINHHPEAKRMMIQHQIDIENNITSESFEEWYAKIESTGNMIGVIDNQRLAGFTLLYCNHADTLDAYICNVFVLNQYRGLGLSVKMLDKAVDICKSKGFKSVSLHVDSDNSTLIL